MITDRENLLNWKKRAGAQEKGRVVLDLEADSLHRYRERLCLIQYADAQGVEIIDPLAIEDMTPFTQWMEGTQVWMHGADYDMCLLMRSYNTLPELILDTQIAARLLGFSQFGLAALVEHYYGITLSKKNQKADWGLRPIPADMIDYAQGDVTYMLDMADRLVAELKRLGRYEWFLESCEWNMQRARERFSSTQTDTWRIKGSGRLTRRGLAALRALWKWRAQEAEEWDRPAFMVCTNDELLHWSRLLQEFRTANPPPRGSAQRISRFRKAIDHFQLLDEEEYPKLPKHEQPHPTRFFEKILEQWIARRDHAAAEHRLEPSIIASRGQLEAIAHHEEEGLSQLMSWQRELLLASARQHPSS